MKPPTRTEQALAQDYDNGTFRERAVDAYYNLRESGPRHKTLVIGAGLLAAAGAFGALDRSHDKVNEYLPSDETDTAAPFCEAPVGANMLELQIEHGDTLYKIASESFEDVATQEVYEEIRSSNPDLFEKDTPDIFENNNPDLFAAESDETAKPTTQLAVGQKIKMPTGLVCIEPETDTESRTMTFHNNEYEQID